MTLTTDLDSNTSPIRVFIDREFPAIGDATAVVRRQLAESDYIPCPGNVSPNIAGHALHAAVSWELSGEILSARAARFVAEASPLRFDIRSQTMTADDDSNTRIAVLAGLMEQCYRSGYIDSVTCLPFVQPSLNAAMAAIDESTVSHVTAVRAQLAPQLHELSRLGLTSSGPAFSGSHLVGGADADMICGRSLVELKAVKKSEIRHFRQLLSYVLLDLDDEWRFESAILLYLRHGHLASWAVQDLLASCGSDRPISELRNNLALELSAEGRFGNAHLGVSSHGMSGVTGSEVNDGKAKPMRRDPAVVALRRLAIANRNFEAASASKNAAHSALIDALRLGAEAGLTKAEMGRAIGRSGQRVSQILSQSTPD